MDSGALATDRVVVVGAGFGIWIANRHVVSGRWGDVAEVRLRRSIERSEQPNLVVLLNDDTEVVVKATLVGYQPFVSAAQTALPKMIPQSEWPYSADGGADIVLFKRGGIRK